MGKRKEPPTDLDREIDVTIKLMLRYKLHGATASVEMVGDKNEIVYTWYNRELEKRYLELEIELNELTRRKLEER